MRRTAATLLTVLLCCLQPSTAHAGAAPMAAPMAVTMTAAVMMPPGDVADGVQFFQGELARYRAAYDAGRFGDPLPGDGERFDALAARLDDLAARADEQPMSEMSLFVVDLSTFLHDLAARPGADPALVSEITTMIPGDTSPPQIAAPVTTIAATTAPPVPTTVPATVPVTSPATSPTTVAATVPATVAPAVTTVAPPAAAAPRAERSSGGFRVSAWQILLVIAAAAVLMIALYAGERWYRSRLPKPTGRPGFHDLLDVSRRLAGAGSTMEVEEMAVRQAMRLTGAGAGAFVRHRDRRLSVGYETEPDLLIGDRLRDGALDRVVGTGHEIMQVSSTEPSIRNVPVSLLAAPVFVAGAVHGAVVLVRDIEQPFDDHDLRMIADLKPIIGAAFEQVHHTERVRAEALADGLTGVRNRRALDLAVADRADTPFAAVMVDLDHFKSVNDTYGHQAGDDLLRAVANRLVANVRPGDEVYRYGGEEFALVLPHTDDAAAAEVAERVRIAIEASPFLIGPTRVEHRATASLGVAAGTGGEQVFARADAALYESKRGGRNRVSIAAALAH